MRAALPPSGVEALPSPAARRESRPRGRPAGSRTRVLADAGALGPHHFAFLRACLQGVDVKRAWDRYLADGIQVFDLRSIESQRTALLRRVVAAGHGMLRSRPDVALRNALAVLDRPTGSANSAPIPTVDEWAATEGIDPDWSEAELLAMYREHFGLETLAAEAQARQVREDSAAAVQALNVIAGLIRRVRSLGDDVRGWFTPGVVACLRRAEISTLEALVTRVTAGGPRWHDAIPGLGGRRAASIVQWLLSQQDEIGAMVRGGAVSEERDMGSMRAWRPALPQLVPLERMAAGSAMRVPAGAPASGEGALADLMAIQSWLSTHEAHPHTHRSYRKEVERFYLWCSWVVRKPLAAITAPDRASYSEFLAAPPPTWVEHRSVAREDGAWRPFRKPLSTASRRQAITVVRILFKGLAEAGHLAGNPWE